MTLTATHGNSLTIYGQANSTGTLTISGVDESNAGIGGNNWQSGETVTINGGTVNASGGMSGAGIGGGDSGEGGTITLSWTNNGSDSIYASSYGGTVTISKGFILDGTETPALLSNIDGNKIVASSKVHALKDDARLTVNA